MSTAGYTRGDRGLMVKTYGCGPYNFGSTPSDHTIDCNNVLMEVHLDMRLLILVFVILMLSIEVCAQDITTLNGVTYKNITVTNVTAEGIDISYSKGGT